MPLRAQSSEFRRFWDAFAVQPFFAGTCLLRHESAGQISFHYATLAYPDGAPPWVTLFTPIAETDRRLLQQLLDRES